MISYACDWCGKTFPLSQLSSVKIKNFDGAVTLHICASDGETVMPAKVQSLLRETKPFKPYVPPPPTADQVAAAEALLSHPKVRK